MSSKKIKPFTIVPKELYVIRKADLQLKQIIEDMGRPGYVLVSRQMGKTNLLLNAKRELDTKENCFSYLDVSNCFSDLRSFFRNIIDTTILAKAELIEPLLEKVSSARQSTIHLQPHKEHELELKLILDQILGKLVICLDEIDALTNVDYSDNVFSLIRSIYFSGRTNYPQFKRLTYVLSGVADPAELIKNKAVSPFNIGEKIYLDDFTLLETKQFLRQCDLFFPEEVIERIYYWTSGNPRVTWDLCSAAENLLGEEVTLDQSAIDRLVGELYLKNHDLPPFDHVRTRVQLDRELRNSVMSIHYGKSSSLSDKVKDRLYLSGISTPKKENGEIFFKNKIMSESLSEKWISDIESELLTIEERANEKVKIKRYDEAISLFKEFLLQASSAEEKLTAKINIGFCFIQTGDIDSAIHEYESCVVDGISNQALLNARRHWSGICYMFSSRFDEAAAQFKEIIDANREENNSLFYLEACINLVSVWLAKENPNSQDAAEANPEIEKLLKIAISAAEKQASLKSSSDNVILYSAHYQLSRYYNITQQHELSIQHLDKALEVSDVDVRSTLLYERAEYEANITQKSSCYVECSKHIIETRSPLSGGDIMNQLRFGAEECSSLLYKLVSFDRFDEAESLFNYIISVEKNSSIDSYKVINASITSCLAESSYDSIPNLVRLALLCDKAPPESLRAILTLGIILGGNDSVDRTDLPERYIDLFFRSNLYVLADSDFRVAHDIFHWFFQSEEFDRCSELLSLIDRSFEYTLKVDALSEKTIESGALILLYLWFRLSMRTDVPLNLPQSLRPYTPVILNAHEFSLTYFPEDYAELLDHAFRSMIDDKFYSSASAAEKSPYRAGKKIGRNDIVRVQYRDGSIRHGKYKKFSEDISSNQCTMI